MIRQPKRTPVARGRRTILVASALLASAMLTVVAGSPPAGALADTAVMVKDINPGTAASSPRPLSQVGATLFLAATDAATGQELWKTDGTGAGTTQVKDIFPGTTGSSITQAVGVLGSNLVFGATDGVSGIELWKSDGTEAGTVLVEDIVAGSVGSISSSSPFVAMGGNVFFVATDPAAGSELWKTDGSEAGTVMVKDINAGTAGASPSALFTLGGTLYFAATDATNGRELWASDGTTAGTVLVKDINPGSESSFVSSPVVSGSTAYFSASDGPTTGAELWRTDGTTAGTVLVKDIMAGPSDSGPSGLVMIGGTVYLSANGAAANGTELWKSDGTDAGTVLVKDVNPGTTSSNPINLTPLGSSLLFRATVAGLGNELHISDGTSAGTVLVKDIFVGTSSSNPSNLAVLGSIAYFSASNGTSVGLNGLELWSTDGTTEGTTLVRDINPGTASSGINNMTAALGTLFFSASNGGAVNGAELWRVRANVAPVAIDDAYSTKIDSAYARPAPGPLGNDTDPDGDALSAGSASDPPNGSIVLNADGSFTYTPDLGFSGTDTFTYVATDGVGGFATGTVTFTVAGINTAPVAGDDTYATMEEAPVTVAAPGVLANDADPDAEPITAGSATVPANGTVALNADGSFTYTPSLNFYGIDTFSYTISDEFSGTDTGTVTITVAPVDDTSAAVNDVFTGDQGTPVTVAAPGVLRNDVEPDGDPFTAGSASDPPNGSVVLNSDGSFTYTPDTAFLGTDTFTYTATDPGGSSSATVTMYVTAPSALAPDATQVASVDSSEVLGDGDSANPASFSVDGNLMVFRSVASNLVAGDTNNRGDIFLRDLAAGTTERINVTSAGAQATGGVIGVASSPTISSDGRYVVFVSDETSLIASDTNNRADLFVKDRATGAVDRVNISETGAVLAPTLGNMENMKAAITPDGRYVAFSSPQETGNRPSVFVRDRLNGTTEILSVDTDGVPIPSPPAGQLNFYTVRSMTPDARFVLFNATPSTLVANDTNGVEDVFVRDRLLGTTERVNVSSAELQADGQTHRGWVAGMSADGSRVVFGAEATNLVADDTNGAVDVFLRDRSAGTTTRLNVDGSASQAPAGTTSNHPVISYDGTRVAFMTNAALVPGDNNVPSVDTGSDGFDTYVRDLVTNTITVESVSSAGVLGVGNNAQAVSISGDGDTLAFGSNASNLVANDTNGKIDQFARSLEAQVAPVAFDDAYATGEDTPLVVPAPGVLGNDTDANGDPLTAGSPSSPTDGAVTLNADGSFTYTPNTNFNGTDSFTYTASDEAGGAGTATVTITVGAVNDAPAAVDDAYTTAEDVSLTVPAPGVLANDTDAEGATLSAGSASDPAGGTVVLSSDGSFTYTPDANFSGSDTFAYVVADGSGGTDSGTVTITVSGAADNPVAVDDAYSTGEDVPLTVPAPGVVGNDTDADGNTLTTSGASTPANGTVTLAANGGFVYTPNANFSGTDTFTYTVSDGNGGTDTGTVTITVSGAADNPVAVDDAYTTAEDGPLTVPAPGVVGNDTDPDGNTLTASGATTPANGTVTLAANGGFTYTPNANFSGTDSFSYTVSDGTGRSDTGLVTITVTATNGSAFHPLTPTRILDSRPAPNNVGPFTTPWGPGTTRDVSVTGAGVPAGADAVTLNVTVTDTTGAGFLTIWPKGQPQPVASNLNWAAGQTIPNAVTVKAGAGGQISVANPVGSTQVIIDIVGYYDGQPGDGYTPLDPARILDSRPAPNTVGPFTTPWGPGTTRQVTVTGAAGVPANADAVVLNATVTGTTAAGFLTIWPNGQPQPVASSLNWAPGQTIANAVTVKVGTGGQVSVFNQVGDANVIFDVVGFFAPGTGHLFHPLNPARVLDTRPPPNQVGPHTTPWPAATNRDMQISGNGGIPANAAAALLNATVTGGTATSFLTIWPAGQPAPPVSSLNWVPGDTIPNAVTTKLSASGAITIRNFAGTVHVIADANGWYG